MLYALVQPAESLDDVEDEEEDDEDQSHEEIAKELPKKPTLTASSKQIYIVMC